jgi:transcriptional regulator with XRE-family HTH domain
VFQLRVREVAELRGYNMSSLSRAANINFRTVKNIYRFPRRDLNLSTLIKIARVLHATLDDLVEILPESEPF